MVRNNAEHYYTKNPTSKLKPREIKVILRGEDFIFHTGSGIFSPDRVDKGTKLLIEKAEVKSGDSILDLGCGYGAVGISIGKTVPKTKIILSDINERAVLLTNKNLKANQVKGKARSSDCFENIKDKFDVILLNPPQTAGKKLCFKMIEESKQFLKNGGNLQLVARHQKGGKTLSQKMEEVFDNIRVVSRGSGYRIYLSEKRNN